MSYLWIFERFGLFDFFLDDRSQLQHAQLAGSVGRSIEQAFGHMVGEMDRDKTAVYLETDTFVM